MKNFYLYIFTFIVFNVSCNNSPKADKKSIGKNAESQIKFSSITEDDKIDWKDFEVKLSADKKAQIINKIKPHFEYIFQNEFYQEYPFSEKIHILDLSGDKNLDVVFEGWSGGEPDNTQFFLNKNDDFVKVFDDFQYLKNLDFQKGVLSSFTMLDFGCCAEYVWFETTYKVNQNFKVEKIIRKAIADFTDLPKSRNKIPQKIYTKNSTILRSSPEINDTGLVIYDVEGGNKIAEFPKSSQGYSWAEQSDKNGNKWLFVEMKPAKKFKSQVFENQNYIFGWVRKNDVEIK
ncbi:MAG: hypothetical protein ACXWDO_08305 [Bacteroidia bacterium]